MARLNVQFQKQNLVLTFCVVLLTSFTLSLLQRTKREKDKSLQLARKSKEVNALLQTKELSKSAPLNETTSNNQLVLLAKKWMLQEKDRRILEHFLLLKESPWEPDDAAVARYREDLRQCCNASFWLVATKENSPLGSKINLDGKKGEKLQVKADMFNLLPERSPFLDFQHKYCAVVGNGGILRNSHCGKEIDQADLILRFNLPPLNYSKDVGTKTSLVTINPSILQIKFNNLMTHRKPFADALRSYGDALFLIPSFSFIGHVPIGYRALYTMEDFGQIQRAFFMNPHYLHTLNNYWAKKGLRPRRLSSGFMFVNMALEFCQHVTLYGFWPFPDDLEGQPIAHHYYDNRLPNTGVHAMPAEFSYYLSMYDQGVLRLQLGKCK